MICSSSSPPIRRRSGEGCGPRGFTMVELLVVILILAILIALLLPAINGALRTAKNAAVGAEINQLAQALAAFKAKYGDYPPSRIYLSEDGNLMPKVPNAYAPVSGAGDLTYAQLGQRSIAAMRKLFPRVIFNLGSSTGNWYDFNGDGQTTPGGLPQAYILQGHECLVFFLGGIPYQNIPGNFSMSGFGKNPANPFTNNISSDPNLGGKPNPWYSGNRDTPLFEFVNSRLVLDPNGTSGVPGYLDTLGNPAPTGAPNAPINFYAYFSAYGNAGYDPNDVNFLPENYDTVNLVRPELQYHVNFPVPPAASPPTPALSPAPNPYTSVSSAAYNGTTYVSTTFLNPQSFQIISSGVDGTYGLGGQYLPDASESLPYDTTPVPGGGPYINNNILRFGIRISERDNVTNFHNGKLE